MKIGMWKIGFGHKTFGDNYASVRVTARTGEEAIEKAKKAQDDGEKLYIDNVMLVGRVD